MLLTVLEGIGMTLPFTLVSTSESKLKDALTKQDEQKVQARIQLGFKQIHFMDMGFLLLASYFRNLRWVYTFT